MPDGTPQWKWELNPNTIGLIILIVGGFIAWGYAIARFESGLERHETAIIGLERRVGNIESETRRIDRMEFRVEATERRASRASDAMTGVQSTLNQLRADMQVTQEILGRLERGMADSNGNRGRTQ